MPSHLQQTHLDKDLPLPEGVTLEDVKANDHADVLAGEAADRQEICRNVASDHLYHFYRTKNIQRRLVDIIQSPPKREYTQKLAATIPPPPTPLEEYFHTSQYNIAKRHNTITCSKCYNALSLTNPKSDLIQFCETPCTQHDKLKGPSKLGQVQIGTKDTHPSHTLRMYR